MQIKTPLASLAPSKLSFLFQNQNPGFARSVKNWLSVPNKKLRSLRSLRQNLAFCSKKTPLTSLAPSIAATSAILAERPTLHCLLHIHGSCLLHMQHAMTTHTTLTHGGFLISKYTVVWGPRWYHFIFGIFLGPKFLAWVQLGPTHLGPWLPSVRKIRLEELWTLSRVQMGTK